MVDVKTTEADVIGCYVSLLADVIANVTVADVMTTHNIKADVIACYISLLLADVIAYICGRCYDHLLQHENMFVLADVIAIYICGRCYNHQGRCYCLLCLLLADVIANV